jgi:glyoxylase-like metal-dependent hydrolase (beta-lactamase superfamily II)
MRTAVSHVSRRALGDGEAAVLDAAELCWMPHFADDQDWRTDDTPLASDGRPVYGVNGLYVRAGGARIVVDPGCWPATQTALGTAEMSPRACVSDCLAALDVAPESIAHVLITHGHPDHFTGVLAGDGAPRFPNARHHFPAADWRRLVVDDDGGQAAAILAHLGPIAAAGLLDLVEGDVDVTDAVTLLSAPGETQGHQVVRVQSGDDRLYYLGDLFHFPAEFLHLEWIAIRGRDGDLLVPARRRILADAARAPATLVFTHAVFPAWGTVTQIAGDAWRWRYDDRKASDGP